MSKTNLLAAAALALVASSALYGSDYFDAFNPSTPLRQSSGLVNDLVRKDHPSLSAWDIGAQVRLRYEIKDNFGIPGAGAASVDFTQRPGTRVDNEYFLDRIKPH